MSAPNRWVEYPRLTTASADGESHPGFRAVGSAASKLAAQIIGKRGRGTLGRLKAQWTRIIGNEWAVGTWPLALGNDGVLKLCAVSTIALDLQHIAPHLIERINLFFGGPVVRRLTLVQGTLPLAPAPCGEIFRPLTPNEEAVLDRRLAEIANPELRAALTRLGRAVFGAQA